MDIEIPASGVSKSFLARQTSGSVVLPTRPLGLFADPEKTPPSTKQSMWHRLGLRKWLGRDDRDSTRSPPGDTDQNNHDDNNNHPRPHTNLTRRLSRRVGVGLPRAPTFKRQNSERRDRLAPFEPEPRAASADRRRTLSVQRTRSPQPDVGHRLSAPEVQWYEDPVDTTVEEPPEANDDSEIRSEWNPYPDDTDVPEKIPEDVIEQELEKRWILNLSMHFRDRSQREKFFVTYAETPNRWRRVTISCDYRGAPPDSLEWDLKELRYQRDKCARIYESLRDSLPEIQFYDTVTNLKLETRDGRLHVHVTEDVNEIIPYPPISCVGHLYNARLIPENELHFDAHLSGFVYNVRLDDKIFIKKEIPGPDTVDEFLYEINALHALNGSRYVIQVEGIVVDDRREVVKGLLISYAEQGALVDILYEQSGKIPWERREQWAEQIIHGLCEIHESGYVQGDFTLSNIVVDADNNAKIIDINRRGCPVGWEPPEIAAKIESNQRISMYIGVKTDLFQLGMTLWALAMQNDEPERQDRPLFLGEDVDVPDYYRKLVAICMSSTPRHRLSAKELLGFFPKRVAANHYLPSIPYETDDSLKLRGHPLSLRSGSSVPANDPSPVMPDGLDGAFSLNQYDSNSDLAPPYAERDSHAVFLDGETKREAHLVEYPQIDGLPPDRNQLVQPLDGSPRGQTFADYQNYSPHSEHSASSREVNGVGGVDRISVENYDMDSSLNLHPYDKNVNADEEPHSPLLGLQGVPKEALGTTEHKASCLRHTPTRQSKSAWHQESPILSSATESADLYLTPVAESGSTYAPDANIEDTQCQKQAPSVVSLLSSILPINPAFDIPKQEPAPTSVHENPSHSKVHSTLGYGLQGIQEDIALLSDSKLPINPAMCPTISHPPQIPEEHISYLSDSRLPINPAFIETSPPL
ncbi:Protein kinase domain-containing protein [Aspergillus sclerotialis]|uniref:Protein kinase domain-containing protein n=1 Tax=Aspergillus sclerotialis TaxID=2070753 RepID=A0A3A2ZCF2_9EURO|nr:Protein kinase domain-containing protein [Aspergillus sclerotialis]